MAWFRYTLALPFYLIAAATFFIGAAIQGWFPSKDLSV